MSVLSVTVVDRLAPSTRCAISSSQQRLGDAYFHIQMRLSVWEEYQLSKIILAIEKLHISDSFQLSKNDIEQIIQNMKFFGKVPKLSTEEILQQLFPGSNTTVHSSVVRKYFGCRDIPNDILKKANASKSPPVVNKSSSNLNPAIGWTDVDIAELSYMKESSFQEANQLFTSSLVTNDKELSKKYLNQALESSIIGTRLDNLLQNEESLMAVQKNSRNSNLPLRTDIFIVPNSNLSPASGSNRSMKLLNAGSLTISSHGTLRGAISRPSVAECRASSRTLVDDAYDRTPTVIYLKASK